jgi:hypothetical protein
MMPQGMPPGMIGGNKNFFFDSSDQSKNSNDVNRKSLNYQNEIMSGTRRSQGGKIGRKNGGKKGGSQIGGLRVIPKYIEPYSNPYQPIDEAKNKAKFYFDEKKERGQVPINYSVPQQDPLNGTTQAYVPPPQNFQGTSLQLNIPQPNPLPQKVQQTFNPTYYVPMMNPYAPNTQGNPYLWHPAVPPIVQKYNITFGGTDVTRLGEIYEDMLPTQIAVAKNTFNSLSERLLVINYLRTVLIKQSDGEDISFDSKLNPQRNALLSHLKIIGVNPYNYNKMTNNPYTGLPDRMIVYKSCYPIKVNEKTEIKCANDNIGINVRMYQLLEGEAILNMVGEPFRKFFEVWREITYYEYVREEIVKKNMSPNFVTLISYFIYPKSLIDFLKYRQAKDSKADPNMEKYNQIYNEYVNDQIMKIDGGGFREKLFKMLEDKYKAMRAKYDTPVMVNPVVTALSFNSSVSVMPAPPKYSLATFADFINDKMNSEAHYMNFSETCLIALTEAPTQNIMEWASRKYEQNGINVSILRMISTGYHDPPVWRSVLFQLQSGLYILKEKGICIWNFNLENNVYIKETNYDNNNIGYWKYKVNGIEFYVPNYGAICLIDTNFKDLDVGGTHVTNLVTKYNRPVPTAGPTTGPTGGPTTGPTVAPTTVATLPGGPIHVPLPSVSTKGLANLTGDDFRYKIMMKSYFDASPSQKIEIDTRNDHLFKNEVFTKNILDSSSNKKYGGIAPPKEILSMVDDVRRDGNTFESLVKNYGYYLHNRCGTLLNEQEKKNVVADNKDFVTGDLVAFNDGTNNLNLCVFVKHNTNPANGAIVNSQIIFVKRDVNNNVTKTEFKDVELASISMISDKIKQIYKPSMKMSEEDLIETYEINF